MRLSRARYVTLCQQSLVTAVVLVVGVSAAGVKTLDIVPQPTPVPGAQAVNPGVLGTAGSNGLAQDALARKGAPVAPARSEVDTTPVTPTVREVKVADTPAADQRRARAQAQRSAPAAPAAPATPSVPTAPSASGQDPAPQRTTSGSLPLVATSAPEKVTGYATVGVTWNPGTNYTESQVAFQIRTLKSGVWSAWQPIQYHDDHGPDGDPGELTARARPGTDALVVGDVDRVQMRAESAGGVAIPGLQLALIDPGAGTMTSQAPAIDPTTAGSGATAGADRASTMALTTPSGRSDRVSLSAMKIAPRPYIYSRAQWGANEKLREQGPPSYGTVLTSFIHHTVNANNYTADQVPALIRGIYAYHTQSRGWRDIGYNFLVDRFGRIWEGRWGGADKAVIGAHTLGYNEVSFAMSAIGNYDIAEPPQAVLDAFARLYAWKLSLYNIRADATHLWVKNRYLYAINGHRDVYATACPGRYLYAKIPSIRIAAQRIQNAAQTGTPTPTPTPAPTPTPTPTPPVGPPAMTSPTQTPRAAVAQPRSIVLPPAHNFVGTSAPDLVLKASDGAISVLPTLGQTGFGAPVTTTGTGGIWSTANLVAAVGDVTGDGKGDVLTRFSNGYARIYPGDGAGHFSTTSLPRTSAFSTADRIVTAGDWNRDGKPDLLMRTTPHGYLYLVPGLGGGRFGTPVLLTSRLAGYSSFAVAGDLNGDGRPDLLALKNGEITWFPSTAGGGLGAATPWENVGTSYDSIMGAGADMTGDGLGDVVGHATNGQLGIFTSQHGGAAGPSLGMFNGVSGLQLLSSAQVMGTSRPDVVGLSADKSSLVVLPNNGMTNVGAPIASNLVLPDASQVLAAGDWNRDGKADLITRQTNGNTLVLRPGLGNGTFGPGVVMLTGWANVTDLSAVGDVTGDGYPDLVGRTSAHGPMVIFPGNGKSGFYSPILAPATMRTYNQVGTGSWRTGGLPGSGYFSSDGSFVPYSGTSGGDLWTYDLMVGPGDLDGDGLNDMVGRDRAGSLWLLPGTATGYRPPRLLATGFGGYSLVG